MLAHALWTAAATKLANKKFKKRVGVLHAALWGIFPDIFAGIVPFILTWGAIVFTGLKIDEISRSYFVDHFTRKAGIIYDIWLHLYLFGHSLIIFAIVFGLIWFVRKKPVWAMSGWLFHILIDIPTHTGSFYTKPFFLWPISDIQVSGVSWRMPWFMIVNYLALIIVFHLIKNRERAERAKRPVESESVPLHHEI